jgi:hypothetical protein
MQAAKIDEFARFVEDEGEAVVRIQRPRTDLAVLENDQMRNIVVIDEQHLVPALTVTSAGAKVKLSMAMLGSPAAKAEFIAAVPSPGGQPLHPVISFG